MVQESGVHRLEVSAALFMLKPTLQAARQTWTHYRRYRTVSCTSLAFAEKVNEGGTTEAWPFVLLWMKGLFVFCRLYYCWLDRQPDGMKAAKFMF